MHENSFFYIFFLISILFLIFRLIFDKYHEHQNLWQRLVALESKENDPGRFKNRGGQLLREEKERKLMSSKLPKIREEITELANEYESRNHRKFLINGCDIVDVITEIYESRQKTRDNVLSARKAATQKKALTPSGQSMRTPMSVSKSVPMLKRTASTTTM